MADFTTTETQVSKALFQFFLPFTYKADSELQLRKSLENHQFTSFQLNDLEQEDKYYGGFTISHRNLESFFLPMTNKILFPSSGKDKGYHRYSKKLSDESAIAINDSMIPFQIHSVDVILCPYELGIVTIRIELNDLALADAITFTGGDATRIHLGHESKATILYEEKNVLFVIELVRNIVPGWDQFIKGSDTAEFDSKIYLLSFLSVKNDIKTQYHYDDYGLACISSQDTDQLTSHFYGRYYYALLTNLYHRLFFLKLLQDYADINIEGDKKAIRQLIYTMNSFTSNYYFVTIPRDSGGAELFNGFKQAFHIDSLYQCSKEILTSLFHYQQNTATKRDSFLLLILTLYTVICGIFSMNLFTHDLEGNIHWERLAYYNPFEYLAVFIVFSGMIIVMYLAISSLIQGWQDKKLRKKWIDKAVISPKKE
ncbi:hypothetical protein [Neobacillus niacini]|uniref:hypothetical protein n=1 Tax=Neobacillus niacini TaxID=86668 RepID=UPI0021CB0792|nr:hypothetical protein [Neobacillus niacini]MCM3764287.1 hypothetical protein [Neobacillus niacini]